MLVCVTIPWHIFRPASVCGAALRELDLPAADRRGSKNKLLCMHVRNLNARKSATSKKAAGTE
eukprot:scaffold72307_cov20-Tisochrysis_lutea.AAC.1